ncbi:MAG: lipopolysaccharide heptosyltransferase II [Candidatus Latescibacteria bacterium]|nr:lipopolysaccharide heptosyltransferase II [bacterium]MBD3423341.1 lipopolysaccharide heptosyltransferase II [Candidatus Latescibacterota bacterium]
MKKEPTGNSTKCISGNNILVIAPNWLGDAVMSLPFFCALRKAFPGCRITVACRRYVSEIFSRCRPVDRLLPLENGGILSRVLKIRKGSAEEGNYARGFVLPPSFSSALLAFLSGVRNRTGYRTDARGMLLTESLKSELYRHGHLVDGYLRLIALSGGSYELEEDEALPALDPPPDWKPVVKSLKLPERYAVMSPGASYGPAKLWPGANYRDTARMINSGDKMPTVFVGSQKEKEYIAGICNEVNGGINLAGRIDIHGLISVLRGAEVVIGNDSGTVHISAALGVPTVAVFGSTNAEWTAPRGRSVSVLSSGIPCSPCYDRECGIFDYAKCYDDIVVADVLDAIHGLIERS